MTRKHWIATALAAGSLMSLGGLAHAERAVVATGPGGTVLQVPGAMLPVPGPVVQVPGPVVQMAPPAPIYEAAPAPRAGWTWTPGFYEWRGDRYVWTTGRWIENRPGYAWQPARWEQRPDGSWYLVGGQFVRADRLAYGNDGWRGRRFDSRRFGPYGDLDGDGILNKDDRDRDGDGIRNRDDDFPNDASRS